jgi:hypothetical protein
MVVSLRWLTIIGVILFVILHRLGGMGCFISTRFLVI